MKNVLGAETFAEKNIEDISFDFSENDDEEDNE